MDLKTLIKLKIKKIIISFIIANIPIILGIFIFIVFLSSVSLIFNFFTSWLGDDANTSNENLVAWVNQLSEDEVEEMKFQGVAIDPRIIPKYIEFEQKTIPKDKVIDMKIIKKVNGVKSETNQKHTLELSTTASQYKTNWQLLLGIDTLFIKDKGSVLDADLTRIEPSFKWLYDTNFKEVTTGTQSWVRRVNDGNSTTTKQSESISTYYYPKAHLASAQTIFAEYDFEYKKDVKVSNTAWVEVDGSRKTKRWTTGGNPIYKDIICEETGEIIGREIVRRTRIVHHSETTWKMGKKIIIEDQLSRINKTFNPQKLIDFFNEIDFHINDIGILIEILKQAPNTNTLINNLKDVEAITLAGLDFTNFMYAPFNPNIPIIEGDWAREDLVATAMSLLDLYYFWGGKYPKLGANPNWGKPTKVSASGSRTTGQIIPLGLDCSGFVDWVYYQMTNNTIGKGGGTVAQFINTFPVSENKLRIGDIGFYQRGGGKHNGIFIGVHNGKKMFIHSGGRQWGTPTRPNGRVVITYNDNKTFFEGNAPSNFLYFRRPYVRFKDDEELVDLN